MLLIRERGAEDCCTAMTPNEVSERLKLSSLQDKLWNVVPSCATTGEGLFEGLVCIPSLGSRPEVSDNFPRVGCRIM